MELKHVRPPVLPNCIGFVVTEMDRLAWARLWANCGHTYFSVQDRAGAREENATMLITGLHRDDSLSPDQVHATMCTSIGNGGQRRTIEVVCEDWKWWANRKKVSTVLIYPAISYCPRRWCTIGAAGRYYYRRHQPPHTGHDLWVVSTSRPGYQQCLVTGKEEPINGNEVIELEVRV